MDKLREELENFLRNLGRSNMISKSELQQILAETKSQEVKQMGDEENNNNEEENKEETKSEE